MLQRGHMRKRMAFLDRLFSLLGGKKSLCIISHSIRIVEANVLSESHFSKSVVLRP